MLSETIRKAIDLMARQRTTIADLRTKLAATSEEYQNFQVQEELEDAEYAALQQELEGESSQSEEALAA